MKRATFSRFHDASGFAFHLINSGVCVSRFVRYGATWFVYFKEEN